MASIKIIKEQFGDNICRKCINSFYDVKLEPKDCVYGYTYICPRCKEARNIVVGFKAGGKMKMMFK